MSAKHSKGPWEIVDLAEESFGKVLFSIVGKSDPITPPFYRDIAQVIHRNGKDVTRANAHLIAAAPDLLAALQGYVDAIAFGGGTDKQSIMDAIRKADDIARAAIAKAEGGAA